MWEWDDRELKRESVRMGCEAGCGNYREAEGTAVAAADSKGPTVGGANGGRGSGCSVTGEAAAEAVMTMMIVVTTAAVDRQRIMRRA